MKDTIHKYKTCGDDNKKKKKRLSGRFPTIMSDTKDGENFINSKWGPLHCPEPLHAYIYID